MSTADVAGVRLYYEDRGVGVAVLLLHGIGASGEDWEGQVPAFSSQLRVIVPDLRGYGRSERRGPYSVEQFASDCWALLTQLGVQRCHIVGHSMGGAVAAQMALDAPERLLKLVLADTLPSFRPDRPAKWGLLFYRLTMMTLVGPRRLSRAVSKKLFPAPEQQALRERVAARNGRNSRWVYLKTIPRLAQWSVTARLAELRMPVLLLVAEDDYFPVTDAQAHAAAIPGARLEVLYGLHHSAPIEAPERFNPLVLGFLQSG